MNRQLRSLYRYYYRKFREAKLPIANLEEIIDRETLKAKKHYRQLANPRIYSLESYIYLWVKEALEKRLVLATTKSVDFHDPKDNLSQALANFFYYLPREISAPIKKRIFNAPIGKRRNIWANLNLPLENIEKRFRNLIKARIEKAPEHNYASFLKLFLESGQVPFETYNDFATNIDRLIAKLNYQLPKIGNPPPGFYSEFNLPCFICQLPNFPFRSIADVFKFVEREYPPLGAIKSKIKIRFRPAGRSFTIYNPRLDILEIYLNRTIGIRQLTIILIHELAHVISLLNSSRKARSITFINNKFKTEIKAMRIEITLLKKISQPLYRATLGEVLLFPFRNTLFEIELYRNPNSNISKLYAQSFNRCFLQAKQKNNPLYLLDEMIVLKPFALLSHAVARYKVLKDTA